MASEEMETIHRIPNRYPKGEYLLMFDPLDGSSNIDVNVSIGTIFSVLKAPEGMTEPSEQDFMQPGTKQVAAGYAVYGPQTVLVLTTGDGVHCFTLDREMGAWVLTQKDIKIPEDTKEFAINASNQRHWFPPVTRYVDEMLAGSTGPRGKDFNMRWIASMVADVHRILNRGGIFMYPADAREPGKPGKLRLMYEANPMAFIVEQAGGAATDGQQRILDIQPEKLHQRVAVFLGSKNEVERVTSYHKEYRQSRRGRVPRACRKKKRPVCAGRKKARDVRAFMSFSKTLPQFVDLVPVSFADQCNVNHVASHRIDNPVFTNIDAAIASLAPLQNTAIVRGGIGQQRHDSGSDLLVLLSVEVA